MIGTTIVENVTQSIQRDSSPKNKNVAMVSQQDHLAGTSDWRKECAWRMTVSGTRYAKRFIDIVGSLILSILLFPFFLIAAILIKLTDGGPVLFWQTRVGQGGREFFLPKLRSMRMDAEAMKDRLLVHNEWENSVTFKMKNDPRITWIGRILRRFSIDELPQLWCVLKGEMSLVGPRPPIPCEVARYNPEDRRRLAVRPGLTCIWQVSGRSDIPFKKQVELDVQYIESQSVWLDIQILLKTIPAVLLGKGAY